MRLSLTQKIAMLVVGMTLAATAISTQWLSLTLEDEELRRSSDYLERAAVRFEMRLDGYRDTLRLITNLPQTKRLLTTSREALSRSGQAFRDTQSYLNRLFKEMVLDHDDYAQLRVLNLQGMEVVRVDRVNGRVFEVTPDRLQDKGQRGYFKSTIPLPQNVFFYSPINLNREHGVIPPDTFPTIRIATPVYSENRPVGIAIVNLFVYSLFREMFPKDGQARQLYITNLDGDYLYHPDLSRTFGFDWGTRHLLQDEFTSASNFYLSSTNRSNFKLETSDGTQVLTLIRALYDPRNHQSGLVLGELRPEVSALGASLKQRHRSYLLTALASVIGLLLAALLARGWTRPLNMMTATAAHMSDLDILDDPHKDEIALLNDTFHRMVETLSIERTNVSELTSSLRRSNATLEGILNGTSDIVAAIDRDYCLTTFNKAYEEEFDRLYGRNIDVGDDLRELLNHLPSERAKLVKAWHPALNGRRYSLVEHFGDPNKPQNAYEMVFSPIRDDAGTIIGAAHIARERTLEIEHLVEREERLSSIMENVADGILTFDQNGAIDSANRVVETIFGCQRSELIGNPIGTLIPSLEIPDDDSLPSEISARDFLHREIGQLLGGIHEVEGRPSGKDVIPLEMSIAETTLLSRGKRIFVMVLRDIRDRKEQEAVLLQAQKMEAIGQLTGGVAHDFNNLLTVIMGNLRIVKDDLKNRPDMEDDLDALVDALAAAEDGAGLTRSLLAFSRKQRLEPKLIVINDTLRDLYRFIARSIGSTIDVKFDLAGDVDAVKADPRQLESALLNLVINSRDAMPWGGTIDIISRRVRYTRPILMAQGQLQPGDYIAISIKDHGTGMDEETLAKAVEPFYTTKEVGKGSGLGLSMVVGFARQSQGGLQIESELDKGTTITLYLPRAISIEDVNIDSADIEPKSLDRSKITVLVVEDNDRVRALALKMIQQIGYRVIEAENGVIATELLRDDIGIDMLFTDLVMPGGINGFQLADWLVTNKPGIPVLIATGYNEFENEPSVGTKPRTEFSNNIPVIFKPYNQDQLAQRLDQLAIEILGADRLVG